MAEGARIAAHYAERSGVKSLLEAEASKNNAPLGRLLAKHDPADWHALVHMPVRDLFHYLGTASASDVVDNVDEYL